MLDASTWVTAIEIPALAGLFWMIHHLRHATDQRLAEGQQRDADAVQRVRDELAEFKLDVARNYVPVPLIRDVDRRLSAHLIRIEEKLDAVMRPARDSAP
jgi:hypothetical protein